MRTNWFAFSFVILFIAILLCLVVFPFGDWRGVLITAVGILLGLSTHPLKKLFRRRGGDSDRTTSVGN